MSHKTRTGDFTTNGQIVKLSGLALMIGGACAIIAIILLQSIYFLTNLLFYGRLSTEVVTPTGNHLGLWVVFVPIVGALLIGLMARYGSEKIRGHGIPEAIEAMLIHESKVQPRVAFWKPISAAISIGTGGPFGAEGPIIMTGGSFGSLLSQWFRLSSIERRVLLVAGAAGGMSATFAAPVSSVLFAVELLMFEFKPRSLVPIALASAVADAIRVSLIGGGPLFAMPNLLHVSWRLAGVAVVIGVLGSLLAVALTRAIYFTEDLFRKIPMHWMWYPAIGAVIVGIGGWVSPRSIGVGYDSISAMLNVKLTVMTLFGLVIVKTVIWVVALGSGTSGGILAPILIIGGSLGGLMGQLTHAPHPAMWTLLGMSAIFAGVTRTPFTSILFPLELTYNLGALLPLLITSCVACGISSLILSRSILTEKIARRGLHLTREYAVDVLQMHYVKEVAHKPQYVVTGDTSVARVIQDMPLHGSAQPWLSVVVDGEWVGIAHLLDVVERVQTSPDTAVVHCINTVSSAFETVTVKRALETLLKSDAKWLRVVSADGKTLGAFTVEGALDLHRRELANESHRRAVFGFRGRKLRLFPKTIDKSTNV